jgi:nucleotide-binding universal stress UspA family protein
MFDRILVPLDGSELAEQALEPALRLAHEFGSEVILLRVAVPDEMRAGLPILISKSNTLTQAATRGAPQYQAQVDDYLNEVRLRPACSGVRVRTEVIAGPPPEVIVAAAEASAVDLIVMSTHGRSGFSRLIYGSVAEAVIRGAHRLVMIVPIAQHVTGIP